MTEQEFLKNIDMPDAAAQCYLSTLAAIRADDEARRLLDSVTDRYDAAFAFDIHEITANAETVAARSGISAFTVYGAFFTAMAPRLWKFYEQKGLGRDLFDRSLKDLTYKTSETRDLHGVWGVHCPTWYPNFFNGKRVAFENLQFEEYVFHADAPFEKDGYTVFPGDPVLNVHLPRTGNRLDYDGVRRAYAQAAEFFKEYFGKNRVVFRCSTWLFFERNFEVIPESANLAKFRRDYEMVQSGEYDDYSQVWRLFDVLYTGDVDALPEKSSLQRFYKDLIRKGEKTGWGRGLYIYK